ncbi:MAG: HAMP domain-containing protein, partial [Desulfobacteraceae bacterium]|nr:HAMP domain-containing protein [Desulfobacteraceae bacterium]
MKFSYKLSVTIFTTGMIVLILLSFAIYQFNYHSVIKSQTEFTESIVNEISDDINHMFSEKIKIALTLANSNTIIQALEDSIASHADLPDEKRKESIKQLNEKWKSTKDSSDKFILEFTDNIAAQFLKRQQKLLKDEYGEIFFTNKFGALVASTSKLSTFSHGHKYWWMESYNNGKGKVFFDDRGYDDSVGGYVLGLVVPIKKGTQIIGILKCNLSILGSISELISDAEHKLFGNFKLTRSGGRVVFEEGFEPLSTQIHDNLFKQLKNNDHGSIIIDDFKEKYLVGFSQIKLTKNEIRHGFGGTFESVDHKKGNKGESWYVLCYRRMSIIQALINKPIKSIFLMGITILIILLLVSYLFGEKIARPLTALNKATQKIGKRDFDYEIDISQNDEFGILAHSFKVMSDKLQKTTTSIDNLENEIGERKKAEYALKNNQKFLNSVIYQSPFATWISDEKGTIIKCNAALEKLLNITEEQLIGKYNVFED